MGGLARVLGVLGILGHLGAVLWRFWGRLGGGLGGVLGSSLGDFGGVLGVGEGGGGRRCSPRRSRRRSRHFFRNLRPSWGPLGALLALGSTSWAVLGPSWGRLGPSKNRCQNRSENRCLLGSIFGRFSTPSWLPKSTKIHEKSMPRCTSFCMPFFDRILIDFCSQLRPTKPQKSLIFQCFFNIF